MDIVSLYWNKGIHYLYNICPINNLTSVVQHGLLCKNLIKKNNIEYEDISNQNVQNKRESVIINGKYKLHDYVNLYFDPRNPMMYTIYCHDKKFICVLCLDIRLLEKENVIVTDGNAAGELTQKTDPIHGLEEIDFDKVFAKNWTVPNNRPVYYENKRIKCAEILIPQKIPFSYVQKIIVPNNNVKMIIDQMKINLPVDINEEMFFIGEKIFYV